jgi:hypothetical protein
MKIFLNLFLHAALLNPLTSTASHYEVDPSLLPCGSITFGYGSGGGEPLIFKLDNGRDVQVGFLKLFLFTEYVDISDIEQLSPFTESFKLGSRSVGRAKFKISIWDTIVVPVVQHKTNRHT